MVGTFVGFNVVGANEVGLVGLKVGLNVVGFNVVGNDGEREGEIVGREVVGEPVGDTLGLDEVGD